MKNSALTLFSAPTQAWFSHTLGKPTAVQEQAWPAIAKGAHTLVSAPTGTGKTLSAFLVYLDMLHALACEGALRNEVYLIYVSPLKSLAGDIHENLRRPLEGITHTAQRMEQEGASPFAIDVAVRTGDTSPKERRRMITHPPHILITTPESLYLMLSSVSGQSILRTAQALILDELHALIGTKRGAHLMLSIARLDALCPKPLQRIGLSATIDPLSTAAAYLAPEAVTIVAPAMKKHVELTVTSPLSAPQILPNGSIWPELAQAVYEQCRTTRSVIAFVEGRMHAEKLAHHVNQIAGEDFARTHHGSMSKEQRHAVEESLRSGSLRLLCATSSMELGIDVGDIDLVLQIGCPRTISSTMQRLGRAGHNPGRTSVMRIFPRTASEGLYCGLTAQVAREGGVEHSHIPLKCLDILAQHLVSMAAIAPYTLDDVLPLLSRAYPFHALTREEVMQVLGMLAGDYEHQRDIPVRPRLLYDRIHGRIEGDAYSRLLAVSGGGTIPDRGMFAVKNESGVKLGELDEEYVFEARVGDKFLLGAFAWKIVQLNKDHVVVTATNPEGARPPFWKGDFGGRTLQTGLAFGKILHALQDAAKADALEPALQRLGLNDTAIYGAASYLRRQMDATDVLPDDKTIIVEHFCDEAGDRQMMVHSLFGKRINAPLSLLAARMAKALTGMDVGSFDDDDGFLLFPYGERALPARLLYHIDAASARARLSALLPATPLFGMAFRYNAARALMMGIRKAGRQPLWVQRLRGAEMLDSLIHVENHPLIVETRRECLDDYWDLDGVEYVLRGIQSGEITVREVTLDTPSPMALPLRRQIESVLLYDYSPTTSGVVHASEAALENVQGITPAREQLDEVGKRKRLPESAQQLHSLLMAEGDFIAGEIDVPFAWLESLLAQERVAYIEPGLWIAREHLPEYEDAFEHTSSDALEHIVRRALRYRGAQSVRDIAVRYALPHDLSSRVLDALCAQGEAVQHDEVYHHAQLYERARRETIKQRREAIQTQPPQSYAALLAQRVSFAAPPEGQLVQALKMQLGQAHPLAFWEDVYLPARIQRYRPAMLDAVLSQGEYFWRMSDADNVAFYPYPLIDWDAEPFALSADLSADERTLCDALHKRGASFLQTLSPLLEGKDVQALLFSLAQRGLVHADSFVPLRQGHNREKIKKATARQRVNARVLSATSGRWDLTRPLLVQTLEEQIRLALARNVLLCRETAQNLPWACALEVLRMWEFTGRARRGYFVSGLSGAQFLLEEDFAAATFALAHPGEDIVWLNAIDPAQPWGKSLAHLEKRAFINVPGTLVALRGGIPIAVLERQGKTLRSFDDAHLSDALSLFARQYARRKLFPTQKRITLKEYPSAAISALEHAGFLRQMQDFVLYPEDALSLR